MSDNTYTPQEISSNLARLFAAPLIISCAGWILYGVTLCQFVNYFMTLARRDHLLTKVWVSVVMILTTAALFYQVYYDWTYSIIVFTESVVQSSIANGNAVALYSVVVWLVQLFWLGCLNRLLSSKPRLAWLIITPIGLVSFSSFVLAITVGALSNITANEDGSWPNGTVSILLRTLLGLDLGVDVSILLVIMSRLITMQKSSAHVKRTISKLSYILCGVTLASALLMIVELVINFPHLGRHGTIHVTISFAPIISPLYAFGILAVLNSRVDLWADRRRKSQDLEGGGLIPGLHFSVNLPQQKVSEIDVVSRDIPLSNMSIDNSPKEPELNA